MSNRRSLLIDSAIIVALVAVALMGYWFSPLRTPLPDVVVEPAANCDLNREACSATLPGGGTLLLDIAPRPIPLVQPLRLKVEVRDAPASGVTIDFAGVDMNMGLNRQELAASGTGHFSGGATLPVCVSGRMAWRATVLLSSRGEQYSIPFRFDVSTP